MDIRQDASPLISRTSTSEPNLIQVNDVDLKQSLIFNLLKKLQTIQQLQQKYETALGKGDKSWSSWLNRHIYSEFVMVYVSGVIGSFVYLKRFPLMKALGHGCIAASLNQYFKPSAIKRIDKDLALKYEQYSENYDQLLTYSLKTYSPARLFTNLIYVNQSHYRAYLQSKIV